MSELPRQDLGDVDIVGIEEHVGEGQPILPGREVAVGMYHPAAGPHPFPTPAADCSVANADVSSRARGGPDRVVGSAQRQLYDRTVRQLAGHRVDELLADASGLPVPVVGGAILKVVVHTPAYEVDPKPKGIRT